LAEYRVELRPAAVRALRKLDPPIAQRVHGAITLRAQDPRPPASKLLPVAGVQIGDYRVIYAIDDAVLGILVLSLGPGHDIYR
jgi:mRNA interferase RelE/StbE